MAVADIAGLLITKQLNLKVKEFWRFRQSGAITTIKHQGTAIVSDALVYIDALQFTSSAKPDFSAAL